MAVIACSAGLTALLRIHNLKKLAVLGLNQQIGVRPMPTPLDVSLINITNINYKHSMVFSSSFSLHVCLYVVINIPK